MISKQLNNLDYPSERWKLHFRGHKFQNFPREHAPRPPTCSRTWQSLAQNPLCKTWIRPAVFQYSSSVKWTADNKFFKGTNTKLEDILNIHVLSKEENILVSIWHGKAELEGAVVVWRLKLTELTNIRALYFERMAGSRMVERLVSYLLSNNTKFLVSEKWHHQYSSF